MSLIKSKLYVILLFILVVHLQNGISAEMLQQRDTETMNSAAHSYEFQDGTCTLRSPITSIEWDAYHSIRQTEIVARYCPSDFKYDYNDPEELMDTNFRFILVDQSLPVRNVVGVIRVDLLKHEESSIRWVAIAPDFQGQGYGRIMLSLVETFVLSQGRQLIRVPAEKESKAFYEQLGFIPHDWPDAPQDAGGIFMAKILDQ